MQDKKDEIELSLNDYNDWKNHPVTKAIFKSINKLREEINTSLTNADILLGPNAKIEIPVRLGRREGLDILLNISYEDIGDTKDEG